MFKKHGFGACEVTWLSDGHTQMPNTIFPSFDPVVSGAKPEEHFRLDIAAYLIAMEGRNILVDTGSAGNFGLDAGRFHQALSAAGVLPEAIDSIVITHLHSDHYGGLLTPDGRAAFPRARLILCHDEWQHKQDPSFDTARAAVAPYAGRMDLVQGGQSIGTDLQVLALPGHTPGHIGLRVDAGAQTLLILGDVLHCPAYQLPNPDWSVIYDEDPVMAAKTRRAILTEAADSQSLILGAHVGSDTPCRVEMQADGFRLHAIGQGA